MCQNSSETFAELKELEKSVQSHCVVKIVDDDPNVLRSYEFMLRTAGWICLTFDSAEKFLSSEDTSPGCLILDIRMPGLSGLQLQQKLEIIERDIPIIFVTGHGDIDMAVQALRRGAKDFLLKPVDPKRLKKSVFECCLSDLRKFKKLRQELSEKEKLSCLSDRELQVATFLSQGLLYKQIADKLGCTERTIKFHKARIAEKLGVKSIVEIAMKIK